MITGLHVIQHRAVRWPALPLQIAVQGLILRVSVHIQNRASVILIVRAGSPVILIQSRIGPHQSMPRRNIRVLIQAEEHFHLLIIWMITAGKFAAVHGIIHACGTYRSLKIRLFGLVNEGGVNGHRVGPVFCFHPPPVCRDGQNPAAVFRLGQGIGNRLGISVLGVGHVGRWNVIDYVFSVVR